MFLLVEERPIPLEWKGREGERRRVHKCFGHCGEVRGSLGAAAALLGWSHHQRQGQVTSQLASRLTGKWLQRRNHAAASPTREVRLSRDPAALQIPPEAPGSRDGEQCHRQPPDEASHLKNGVVGEGRRAPRPVCGQHLGQINPSILG